MLTAIVRRLAPAALGVGVLAIMAAAALPAAAAPGDLDPTFGQNGTVTVTSTTSGGGLTAPSAMLLQPDGKILVVDGSKILRFNPDGTLDSGFGSGGIVATPLDGNVSLGADAALQLDGKIVVTGRIDISLGTAVVVLRFNPNGSPDTSFGSNGQVVTDPTSGAAVSRKGSFGDAVLVQSDGKILVGGWAAGCAGRTCPILNAALLRYNSNGSLDSRFGHGGIVLGEPAATFATLGENSTGDIFGLDAGGGISEFNPSGVAQPTANATSISIASQAGGGANPDFRPMFLPDGRYVIAQGGSDAPRDGDVQLVRHLGTGAVDPSFNNPAFNYGVEPSTFFRVFDEGLGLALQVDGKVIVVGSTSAVNSGAVGIARVNTNGSLDSGFGIGGTIVNASNPATEGTVATVLPDGKILVAESQFVSATSTFNLILARYQAS